ncbi:hypothetical protein [Hyphomonas johnsonii]|nr:hypothetical protein [Hyphomonas johnsonii]
MQVAFRKQLDPEALKAWSQNLGHEDLATSLNGYGTVQDQRTSEIMAGLAATESEENGADANGDLPPEMLAWMEEQVRRRKG